MALVCLLFVSVLFILNTKTLSFGIFFDFLIFVTYLLTHFVKTFLRNILVMIENKKEKI